MTKTIGQRAIDLLAKYHGKKSDTARALLDEGFSAADISRAVPMAYSQVHSINQKRKLEPPRRPQADDKANGAHQQVLTGGERQAREVGNSSWGQSEKAPGKRTMKPVTSPVLDALKKGKPIDVTKIGTGRVGKLRTPGLPSDTAVGECANCGYDLVIRQGREGLFMFHVNHSTEEYLETIQFCRGVPKVLLG